MAVGAFFAINPSRFFSGEWRTATAFSRLVRRMVGFPIVLRLVGVVYFAFGLMNLVSTAHRLISN